MLHARSTGASMSCKRAVVSPMGAEEGRPHSGLDATVLVGGAESPFRAFKLSRGCFVSSARKIVRAYALPWVVTVLALHGGYSSYRYHIMRSAH